MTIETEKPARPRKLFVLLPLLVFLALAAVFLMQLLSGRDLSVVPSALIGQAAPKTVLPPLEGISLPGLNSAEFIGKVTLVNVWASWCGPCRDEHPVIVSLSKDERLTIVGLNYKDKAENARRFLGDLGNPYDAVGVDPNGRAAIDWGVYGIPETFLVGKDGKIAFKHVGPMSPETVATTLMPEIEKAAAASQ
ncbi:DsbE family thiol:disulfide interchange protein [Aminobacter sp. P9b]|uniref:Cytochrome c biogenesis protein CcmG/thiol:disulfide interchange protein DsbE n=1 Tax=Aminobacter niigataensis TaxID=83265 RepID=A0ABR6L639_9HYPH|nr:DsbE family thiol:disulfide interchange protein [Aminobacter niigataensis]MBB4651674.1 cytochrome c biogenesis protein CcmG/thiol:disulfide interchange protein DsbE [Aminobacter niigataensis]